MCSVNTILMTSSLMNYDYPGVDLFITIKILNDLLFVFINYFNSKYDKELLIKFRLYLNSLYLLVCPFYFFRITDINIYVYILLTFLDISANLI